MKKILFLVALPLCLLAQKRVPEVPSSLVQKLADSISVSSDFKAYWAEEQSIVKLMAIGYFKSPTFNSLNMDTVKRNQARLKNE